MQLGEAFEQGRVEGLGLPDRTVTTHLSQLFFFGERIFKVYKAKKYFFADLSNAAERKEFITEDFFWNNAAAPEVCRHLWGVKKDGENFILVPHTLGEDFVIEMSVIDDSKTLTKLLISGQLQDAQAEAFIDTIVDTLATLTAERKEKLAFLYKKSLEQILKEDIENLHEWMLDTDPRIPKADSERLKETLFAAIDSESYFKNTKGEKYCAAIDANSDNLLLLEGKPSMIDIMPPRVTWRIVDEYATISRTLVDIGVLGTAELAEAAQRAYEKYGRAIPERARLVYEIRAAGIQWAYRYMLGQEDLAKKFGEQVRVKLDTISPLL